MALADQELQRKAAERAHAILEGHAYREERGERDDQVFSEDLGLQEDFLTREREKLEAYFDDLEVERNSLKQKLASAEHKLKARDEELAKIDTRIEETRIYREIAKEKLAAEDTKVTLDTHAMVEAEYRDRKAEQAKQNEPESNWYLDGQAQAAASDGKALTAAEHNMAVAAAFEKSGLDMRQGTIYEHTDSISANLRAVAQSMEQQRVQREQQPQLGQTQNLRRSR